MSDLRVCGYVPPLHSDIWRLGDQTVEIFVVHVGSVQLSSYLCTCWRNGKEAHYISSTDTQILTNARKQNARKNKKCTSHTTPRLNKCSLESLITFPNVTIIIIIIIIHCYIQTIIFTLLLLLLLSLSAKSYGRITIHKN